MKKRTICMMRHASYYIQDRAKSRVRRRGPHDLVAVRSYAL